jgi:hypothetical protein
MALDELAKVKAQFVTEFALDGFASEQRTHAKQKIV